MHVRIQLKDDATYVCSYVRMLIYTYIDILLLLQPITIGLMKDIAFLLSYIPIFTQPNSYFLHQFSYQKYFLTDIKFFSNI